LPNLPRPKKNEASLPPMTMWQQAFVQAGWIPSTGEDAAADVLKAMERLEPTLDEIRRASARPKSHWPIKWSEGLNAPAPFSNVLQQAVKAFELRAQALLALDRPDEALAEIRNIIRAAESLKEQPAFLLGFQRFGFFERALDVSDQGLRANKWTASHLKTLSDSFSTTNELASWKVSINGQRCLINHYLNQGMSNDSDYFLLMVGELYGFGRSPFDSLLRIAPRGWVRQGEVETNRRIDLNLERIDSVGELVDPHFGEAPPKSYSKHLTGILPADRLADVCTITPYFSHRPFELHVRVQQFVILAALFRYRETHGELPESLNQLVPSLFKVVPHDIMDGQPMRYRRLENGGCLLWSIGKNRVDDGGVKADPKHHRSNAPDWVSELPPISRNGLN
jgi:hypothetical protein